MMKTAKLTNAARAKSSGPSPNRKEPQATEEIVEGYLEIVEGQYETDQKGAEQAWPNGRQRDLRKAAKRPGPKHHRRFIHRPVVAHHLRKDDEKGEGRAWDRIRRNRRVDVPRQIEDPRVEGEGRYADQQIGDE